MTTSIGRARVSRPSSLGLIASMCRDDPAPAQTSECRYSARSMSASSIFGSGKGATAPGREAGCFLHLRRLCHSSRLRIEGASDLLRVAPAVPWNEDDDRPLVADEHERLHDLIEVAAGRGRRVLGGRRAVGELVDARLDSRIAEEGGHPFDGLRPGPYHARSLPLGRQ